MSHDRETPALDVRRLAKVRTEALASMTVALSSPRTGMYAYPLPAIPTFAPSRLDRLLHPGATTRADPTREDS